ncbi:MAG: chemotaxis protein CheX [Spirochaetales bacterium]|uniref:Chemotaxis protein CheX n=1 Tax=Candidatus Thalassospirochaeta sargassi TaxID=3119039 RepID=A0AAJ1MJY0_9SPIO|nr:chemotaxis protein CheX [Spirochaetales bacterium]
MSESNINLIEKACEEVFKENGLSSINTDSSSVSFDATNITATIGMAGEIQGHLILYSKLDTAVKLVEELFRNMGMDQEISDSDPMFKETFAELLNQLGGRTTIKLSENGIDSDITPPTIIKGNNIYINTSTYGSTAIISISGEFGEIGLFVGLTN